MMNIQNLNPKESIGVKFKEGICAKLCLKLWFESDWYFCNIFKSGGLKVNAQKESSKQSLPKLASEIAICRCFWK